MHRLEDSLARLMEFIHFTQRQQYMVNMMVLFLFMSMDRKKFVIFSEIQVALMKSNILALMECSSLRKAILFIFI